MKCTELAHYWSFVFFILHVGEKKKINIFVISYYYYYSLFILLIFFFLVQKLCFAVAETPERDIPLNCNFLSLKAICLLVKFII
jgi:hypothetical protein